ncbi:MAG: DNRLRE domain-containing protein [Candidatus Bathyarchaeia archaeon]
MQKNIRSKAKAVRALGLIAVIACMMLGLIAPIFSQTTYQIQLYPIEDAYITSQYPSVNYGASSMVTVYRGSLSNYYLIKFNLSGVITQQMPNLRFYLKLYLTSRSGSSYTVRVHPYSNAWHENNVTWSTRPENISAATRIASVGITSAVQPNSWLTFDITNYVVANCLNSICSFAIVYAQSIYSDDSLSTSDYVSFSTKEYSSSDKWPHLLIEYRALTTVTQNITVTSTETVTRTQTVTVTETYTAVELTTTTLFTVIGTATETVTRTTTEYYTETVESTATITDIIYALAYATTTSTITTTLTNTIIDTQTLTQTITQTDTVWAEPVTVTRTVTVTPLVTETITETANAEAGGESLSGEQLNQIVVAIMAIGLIVSILGVLLKASGGE